MKVMCKRISGDDELVAVHPSRSHRSSRWTRSSRSDLSKRGDWCDSDWDSGREIHGLGVHFSIDTFGWAFTRNVTGLSALVASLAGSIQRTSVGCCTIARDVSEFTTSVAFHCLSLAVASEMVWSTALVAGSWARSTNKSTTGWSTKASARWKWSSTAHCSHRTRSSWTWA